MSSFVSSISAATSAKALAHFQALLELETDCWDVNHAISTGIQDFVLLDVRGESAFKKCHIPGAVCLPHSQISQESLAAYPEDTLFIVYCAGPHCNGADRAGLALAKLGRPVKKMLGGVTGWADEGFEFTEA